MSRFADGTYALYSERAVAARKRHRCDACREPIAVGHVYTRIGAAYDGLAYTIKRCRRCQAIHLHLRQKGDGEVWPDERLDCGEEYREHWGHEPPPEVAALAFALPSDFEEREQ